MEDVELCDSTNDDDFPTVICSVDPPNVSNSQRTMMLLSARQIVFVDEFLWPRDALSIDTIKRVGSGGARLTCGINVSQQNSSTSEH